MDNRDTLQKALAMGPRFAGQTHASLDYQRGLSLQAMGKVVQADDHPEWARGYKEQLSLIAKGLGK